MPDPGWLLSLQTNKHVTTNTSVDQTSDELETVSVYAVGESDDARGLFTDDVEKHVINQRRIAPCLLLFVETCPLQRNQGLSESQTEVDLIGGRAVAGVPGNLGALESVFACPRRFSGTGPYVPSSWLSLSP